MEWPIVSEGGEPERVYQAIVTGNFFDTVGVRPAIGRGFQPGEDQPGREREVILSDRLWKRRFGADLASAGKSVRFDDRTFAVVGVMPASFDFPLATEVWAALAMSPEERSSRRNNSMVNIARLKRAASAGLPRR